jgi:hypothetical protein
MSTPSFPQGPSAFTDPRGRRREGIAGIACLWCKRITWNRDPVCDNCLRKQNPRFAAWERLNNIIENLAVVMADGGDESIPWGTQMAEVSLRMADEAMADTAHRVIVARQRTLGAQLDLEAGSDIWADGSEA